MKDSNRIKVANNILEILKIVASFTPERKLAYQDQENVLQKLTRFLQEKVELEQ